MSTHHRGGGRGPGFYVMIALACGLTAGVAAQGTKPETRETATRRAPASDEKASPQDERARVDPVTGQRVLPTAVRLGKPEGPSRPIDPGVVMPTPTTKAQAPGLKPGTTAQVPAGPTVNGNVGPDGKAIGQDAPPSPGGSVVVMDKDVERLGPGGTFGQKPAIRPLEPGGAAAPGPRAAQAERRQVAQKPDLRNQSGPANAPVTAAGIRAFINPATGQLVEPTEAQMLELQLKLEQQAGAIPEPSEVVQRPALGSGVMADVPASLFPMVKATIGADGQITLQERQSQGDAPAVPTLGPAAEREIRPATDERLGPAGDQGIDLPPAPEVTVTIVNGDGAGEGFNDATVVAPVFGNSGTTRGAQRLNAFRAAAEYWGGILKSTVPIRVAAQMNPQFCDATSATLGSAGPQTVHFGFAGAPVANTWYVQAVANSLSGVDQSANDDINAQFNSDVDNPVCLGATSWWYGIGAPAPAGTIDFYTVVLHEIGHGIGVLSLVNATTGAEFSGLDDAYERWLFDLTSNLGWPSMSDAQRAASAVNTGNVVFRGDHATEAARGLLTAGLNASYARVYAPNPVQGGSSISHFDTVVTPNELMEPAITPPPGPYAYLTSGALQDVGWQLLTNGVFDFGAGLGTWTWNDTTGWAQPSTSDPAKLEGWNGNFVAAYSYGLYLRNGSTGAWTYLTDGIPQTLKACGNNLIWAAPGRGTWRYNLTTGWQALSSENPDSVQCFGGNVAWESAIGTWIYNFGTSAWTQILPLNPVGILACGSRLVWWRGVDTWFYDGVAGTWTLLTGLGPETTECYRGNLVWEGTAGPGTWIYNFTTSGWSQISTANPDKVQAWGPSLAFEGPIGTWVYSQTGVWTQIAPENPTQLEALGPYLLWADASGTYVWGGGGGGAGWLNITGAVPSAIVTTGVVDPR